MDQEDHAERPGHTPPRCFALILGSLAIRLVITSSWLPVRAQELPVTPAASAQVSEPSFKLRTQTNVVVVRAVVRDSQGRAVTGLAKADFKISDNRKQQVVTGFSVETSSGCALVARAAGGGWEGERARVTTRRCHRGARLPGVLL